LDIDKCIKTRAIINEVDWECEVKKLFRDDNLGCGLAVSQAISWFFKYEEMGIILEDDCLPAKGFFRFTTDLLLKFQSDQSIFGISGFAFESNLDSKEDYFLTFLPAVWGWATWRDRWQHYDFFISDFNQTYPYPQTYLNKYQKYYFDYCFNKLKKSLIKGTWDYQWLFTVLKNNGYFIRPTKNMITNLGDGVDATHTVTQDFRIGLKRYDLESNSKIHHPTRLVWDYESNKPYLNFVEDKGRYFKTKHSVKQKVKEIILKMIKNIKL